MARTMTSLYDGHDCYKRMLELQEKLRKSEAEKIRLEERFNVLVRDSRDRHDACINRLRTRYTQYLEEQRSRDERNHKLLTALDKVMSKLALISAKRDRLNILRKQYEAYLLRVYANRRQPGSVTGDSGIASQNEDKYTRKIDVAAQPDIASAETRSVSSPRVHPSARSYQSKSTSKSKLHDHISNAVNGISLNNPPSLPTTPREAPLDVNYHQTCVPRKPHIYVSPVGQSNDDQLAQVSALSSPNTRQYPQMVSGYDRSVSRSLQDVTNFRALQTKASVLPMTVSDQIQFDAIPVNRVFKESMRNSNLAQFPTGNAVRYEEMLRNEPVPRRFDPLIVHQYHDANPQSQIREYDSSDVAALGPALITAKSNGYRMDPSTSVNQLGPLPGYMDYIAASPQKSEDEGSIRSLTSDDVDDLMRRNERLWKNIDDTKTSSPTNLLRLHSANLDENGRTAILENELDRYISNIRKLHREHGVPSLEELDHEQNTSGDLLNVSLSEDAAELPAENRAKKERVLEEMSKLLALASDLVSSTGLKEARDPAGQSDNLPAEIVRDEIRHRREADDTLQFERKREAEGREVSAKNEIRKDVATRSTELEQTQRNAGIAKESWNNANDLTESRERDRKALATKRDTHEKTAANNESQIDDQRNVSKKEQFNLVIGEETNIEDLFNVAENLAPWNLASLQKEVRELHLGESDEARAAEKDAEETKNSIVEQSGADGEVKNADLPQDTLSHVETESERLDAREVSESHAGENETRPSIDADDASFNISNQHEAEVNEKLGESKENNGEKQDNSETELGVDDRSENMTKNEKTVEHREYVEDPSQGQQYEQDPNEQYRYEQGMTYEGVSNEEYESYAAQGYAQEGQEYVEYVDGQYEQYPEDANNQQYQHDPNAQYEQDPNQAYDYNYDPNQGYDPNQQYSEQGYDNNDPDNQAYDYNQQASYQDPNQMYDNTYEQEYKEEPSNPNDNVVVENREEKPETEEASQADPERKSDKDESQQEAVNGIKKKKDVIKSLLDSDTDTTIERNVSNTESDFDFN